MPVTRSQIVMLAGHQVGDTVTITTPCRWEFRTAPARVVERKAVANGVVYLCASDGLPTFYPPVWAGELYVTPREGEPPSGQREQSEGVTR